MTYLRRTRVPSLRRSPEIMAARKRELATAGTPSISVRDLGTGSAHLYVNERVPAEVAAKVARIIADHA